MLIFDQKSNPIVKICAEWLTSRADCFTIVHGLFCDFTPHGLPDDSDGGTGKMRMLGKRFLSLLLTLGMLLMLLPAAAASELTMLQVDFLGMYATSAGTYESRKFTGDFTVMQNGEAVGTIRLTDFGSDPISVPGTGNVQLVPVAETMPEDAVMAASYTVSIVDGRLNKAVIAVLTDTGLFTVHTESSASFDLINERGETILSFDTDSRGDYAPAGGDSHGAVHPAHDEGFAGH